MATETIGTGLPDYSSRPTPGQTDPSHHHVGRFVVIAGVVVALGAGAGAWFKFGRGGTASSGSDGSNSAGRNPAGAGAGAGSAPHEIYDDTHDITCDGLTVTQAGGKLVVKPLVTVHSGNPDPSKFVTVVDMFTGANPNNMGDKTTVATGAIGAIATVDGVSGKLDPTEELATVSIYFYGGGEPPLDNPSAFSISVNSGDRIPFACGNAIAAALAPGGTLMNPAS